MIRMIFHEVNRNQKKGKRKIYIVHLSRYILNRNKHYILHVNSPVFSFTCFILCLSFSFSFNDDDNLSSYIYLFFLTMNTLMSKLKMRRLSRLINLNDSNNSYSFARGFDDFAVTWPPSTNTTSINDDK